MNLCSCRRCRCRCRCCRCFVVRHLYMWIIRVDETGCEHLLSPPVWGVGVTSRVGWEISKTHKRSLAHLYTIDPLTFYRHSLFARASGSCPAHAHMFPNKYLGQLSTPWQSGRRPANNPKLKYVPNFLAAPPTTLSRFASPRLGICANEAISAHACSCKPIILIVKNTEPTLLCEPAGCGSSIAGWSWCGTLSLFDAYFEYMEYGRRAVRFGSANQMRRQRGHGQEQASGHWCVVCVCVCDRNGLICWAGPFAKCTLCQLGRLAGRRTLSICAVVFILHVDRDANIEYTQKSIYQVIMGST